MNFGSIEMLQIMVNNVNNRSSRVQANLSEETMHENPSFGKLC